MGDDDGYYVPVYSAPLDRPDADLVLGEDPTTGAMALWSAEVASVVCVGCGRQAEMPAEVVPEEAARDPDGAVFLVCPQCRPKMLGKP